MTEVNVLHNSGTYSILTPPEFIKMQPLIIETAGRTCYQSDRGQPITSKTATKFCKMLINRGHEAMIEHSSLSVRFDLHSRGMTHELVRHRLASPGQESTRYVDYELERNTARAVMPPSGKKDAYQKAFDDAFNHYAELRAAGEPAEDARQVLPIGIKSEIVVTCNLREWRHVFDMRCDKFAHWEIRRTMVNLLKECKLLLPGLFDDFVYAGDHRNIPYYVKLIPHGKLNRQIRLRKRLEEQEEK